MDWYIKKFEQLSLDELYDILKMRSEIFVVEQECVYLDVDGKDKDVFEFVKAMSSGEPAHVKAFLKFAKSNKTLSNGLKDKDFEKYLNVFGSGGLLVGLTLLSKLTESKINYEYRLMLIFGSVSFVVCLLSNLISHYLAIQSNEKTNYFLGISIFKLFLFTRIKQN